MAFFWGGEVSPPRLQRETLGSSELLEFILRNKTGVVCLAVIVGIKVGGRGVSFDSSGLVRVLLQLPTK